MNRVPPQLPSVYTSHRIALIGETPGEREDALRKPFVGPSGSQLNGWLSAAGISRDACLVDNVLSFWPRCPVEELFVGAKEFRTLEAAADDPTPEFRLPVKRGKHLPPVLWPELRRLNDNLRRFQPNVIVALGTLAVWALTGQQGVEAYCGHVLPGHLGFKVVPVIHPAAILRSYNKRPLCIRAMKRVARESTAPTLVVPNQQRGVWLLETVFEVRDVVAQLITAGTELSFDIETHPASGTVRSIGFGNDEHSSYCVVFCRLPGGAGNSWTAAEEVAVVLLLRDLFESSLPKLAQNGAYDVTYLWLALGIRVRNYVADTRLRHHAYSPEEPKDLATLGRKYIQDIGPWKAAWSSASEGKDK